MDIFNTKKVAQLEKQLKDAQGQVAILKRHLAMVNTENKRLEHSKTPSTTTYTIDAKAFAEKLKRCPRKGVCGRGKCYTTYLIPAEMIDEVLNA